MNMENMRTLNLDQLHPWQIYELRQDLQTIEGRPLSKGASFRFEYAIVSLSAKRSEIHGLDEEDRPVVLRSENWEHREWFERTDNEWRPQKKIVEPNPPVIGDWRDWLA